MCVITIICNYVYVDEMYMYNWILLRAPYIYSMVRCSFNGTIECEKNIKKTSEWSVQCWHCWRIRQAWISLHIMYCEVPLLSNSHLGTWKKSLERQQQKKSWNRFDFIYTCHPGLPRTPGVGHWSKKARRPETCHLVTSLMDFGGDFCWWLNHWNFLGSPTWEGT